MYKWYTFLSLTVRKISNWVEKWEGRRGESSQSVVVKVFLMYFFLHLYGNFNVILSNIVLIFLRIGANMCHH